MKNIIILVTFMLVTFTFLSVRAQQQQLTSVSEKFSQFSYTEDDSLLFDGNSSSTFDKVKFLNECYWKVVKIKGSATGRVLKPRITSGCTKEFDTSYTAEDMRLAENDILDEGSVIQTGPDGLVAVAVFLAGDSKHLGSFSLIVGPSSQMRIFLLNELCSALKTKREYIEKDRVTIIKGKVTYESEPGSSIKIITKGKNASVVHTKTLYTHEVKIDGNDTTDIIRVFDGSVEVTYEKTDVLDDEAMSREMRKLSEDMLAGKLTAEEYQVKMNEFQSYGQRNIDLSKPVMVDAGNKCIVTKISINVEPIGADDDRWWEN